MPKKKIIRVVGKKPIKPMRKYVRRPRKVMRKVPRSLTPFPTIMNTQFVYKNTSTNIASSGINPYQVVSWANNNMYDFDTSNVLGNKQPLFYDQCLSADGPYKNYKVNAWKTTVSLINLDATRPLFVFYEPATLDYFQADTPLEVENRRGVQRKMLTASGNSRPIATFSKFTRLKDIAPKSVNSGLDYQAPYNANPNQPVYSTLLWKTIDGSVTSFQVALEITHVFYATLYNDDGITS